MYYCREQIFLDLLGTFSALSFSTLLSCTKDSKSIYRSTLPLYCFEITSELWFHLYLQAAIFRFNEEQKGRLAAVQIIIKRVSRKMGAKNITDKLEATWHVWKWYGPKDRCSLNSKEQI